MNATIAVDVEVDVAVVGGGAAGLAAAVALGRSLRSFVVVDAGEPRNAPAAHAFDVLGARGSARSTCWPPAGRRPAGTACGSSPTGS